MANEKENGKLNEAFDNESNPPRRTAEEWRAIERASIEHDARNRTPGYINTPKTPGQ